MGRSKSLKGPGGRVSENEGTLGIRNSGHVGIVWLVYECTATKDSVGGNPENFLVHEDPVNSSLSSVRWQRRLQYLL